MTRAPFQLKHGNQMQCFTITVLKQDEKKKYPPYSSIMFSLKLTRKKKKGLSFFQYLTDGSGIDAQTDC